MAFFPWPGRRARLTEKPGGLAPCSRTRSRCGVGARFYPARRSSVCAGGTCPQLLLRGAIGDVLEKEMRVHKRGIVWANRFGNRSNLRRENSPSVRAFGATHEKSKHLAVWKCSNDDLLILRENRRSGKTPKNDWTIRDL